MKNPAYARLLAEPWDSKQSARRTLARGNHRQARAPHPRTRARCQRRRRTRGPRARRLTPNLRPAARGTARRMVRLSPVPRPPHPLPPHWPHLLQAALECVLGSAARAMQHGQQPPETRVAAHDARRARDERVQLGCEHRRRRPRRVREFRRRPRGRAEAAFIAAVARALQAERRCEGGGGATRTARHARQPAARPEAAPPHVTAPTRSRR